jgi:uncharacterized protein DUF4124
MRRSIALATLLAAALPAAAGIYRCTAPGGAVSYQEQPCDAASGGGAVAIPTQFPDYIEPRRRLAALEAAADARILERLRIESAERIVRDERLARQAELAAERERAQPTEVWAPVFVGAPLRVRPIVRPHPQVRRLHAHSLPLMR